MTVVADAGPLIYLVLIGSVDVLEPLFDCVLVPQVVAAELQDAGAPEAVRTWMSQPPRWCEIRSDAPADLPVTLLDPGERAALNLALAAHADLLLLDDWEGRAEASRRHLKVIGTLGVLAQAHRRKLLDFEAAVARLRQTTFYMSAELINKVRRQLS